MKKAFLTVLSLIILLVSGCDFVNRDYTVVSPHLAEAPERSGDEMRVENYAGLKNAILRVIESGDETGVIRMYNYPGDAEADVSAACQDIFRNDPLGAFAVEYMSNKCVRVLAYYEATVSVSYRRTSEQIASIREFANMRELDEELVALCVEYGDELTADLPYYNSEQHDIEKLLGELRYSRPLDVMFIPEIAVATYPDSGLRRIIEFKLSYPLPPGELAAMSQAVQTKAADIVLGIDAAVSAYDIVREAVDVLLPLVRYLPDREDDLEGDVVRDSSFTAYGALVEGKATSEGYALALKCLLDGLNVDSRIISGRYDGVPHVWNLVRLDTGWYHVDAALCELRGDTAFLLKTDAEVAEALKWNTASYPAADGEVIQTVDLFDNPEVDG